MGLKIIQVDAFTNRPFSGNPAAVCILPGERDDVWMQNIASEMNLSETAFLVDRGDGFHLRWFTPALEVDLCGHATLASAHVLWEEGYIKTNEKARFHTLSGLLTADRAGDWIELNFPSIPQEETEAPPGLLEALGVEAEYVGLNKDDYLVEVKSEEIVRNLDPDFTSLKKLPLQGVIVTSLFSESKFDFVSRFFAPAVGIDEDPVTGSVHCLLGPFWQDRLAKDEFVAYQASARGGIIRIKITEDRVLLSGQAVTVMKGELRDSI